MEKFNVDAINKVGISNAGDFCFAFKPLWMIATDSRNTDTLNCRYHNHAFYELHIIAKGKILYGFEDEELKLYENQFAIIPPKLRHKVVEGGKNIEKFTLAFEIDSESEVASLIDGMTNRAFFLDENCLMQFERTLNIIEHKQAYKEEQIYLSLCSLLFGIAGQLGKGNGGNLHHTDCDDRVFKAKKYVEDNFDAFFSCQEVAAYCKISEKQLGRLFIKYENMSLLEYIHTKKLEAIKKMLSDKEVSHKEVSDTLGFSSPQYYGSFLKRMTGMTSEEFRRSITNC